MAVVLVVGEGVVAQVSARSLLQTVASAISHTVRPAFPSLSSWFGVASVGRERYSSNNIQAITDRVLSKVADILISTLEPPPELEVLGQGGLIQARVLRLKKDLKGEHDAREVSDALPFLEYEMHRQLVNKLKVKGMNAIFGLHVSLSLADRMLVGLASGESTNFHHIYPFLKLEKKERIEYVKLAVHPSSKGTAVCLPALPSPALPRVLDTGLRANRDHQHAGKLQERLREKVEANKEYFGLQREQSEMAIDDGEVWEEQQGLAELDLSAGNKDTCVLEVDDIEDTDIVDSLLDNLPPKVCSLLHSFVKNYILPSIFRGFRCCLAKLL